MHAVCVVASSLQYEPAAQVCGLDEPAGQNSPGLHCCFVTEFTQYHPAGQSPSPRASSADRLAGHHAPSESHDTLLVVDGQ